MTKANSIEVSMKLPEDSFFALVMTKDGALRIPMVFDGERYVADIPAGGMFMGFEMHRAVSACGVVDDDKSFVLTSAEIADSIAGADKAEK